MELTDKQKKARQYYASNAEHIKYMKRQQYHSKKNAKVTAADSSNAKDHIVDNKPNNPKPIKGKGTAVNRRKAKNIETRTLSARQKIENRNIEKEFGLF